MIPDLLAAFRLRFVEFSKTDDAIVSARIADAMAECSEEAFAETYPSAVLYLAAHLLAISPYGQSARATQTSTTYWVHFDRLQTQAAVGPRVL